ncbi:cysteine hydrolase family protein [Streptomyces sp. C10-9-1]|uniref:cysteine hydrolase family protein n=1 Tax=Streptomyces sp. C10-9-1 TaxID=1859285 RepID=UPI003D7566C0
MSTAVLVIDMQNGFCRDDGSFPTAGFALPQIKDVIARNAELVAAARLRNIPVIYTRHVLRPDRLDADAWLKKLPLGPAALEIGSHDADIIDELAPAPGDVVVDKNRFDAFLYTELETVLRALDVRRVIVSGVVTSVCVESSVRSGYQRGFDMLVAADCVSGPEPLAKSSLRILDHVFAEVLPWAEALDRAGR